mmetsp:Transcript_7360/g.16872  ORF Transcript_7360/g.16872 Transcript_7360/m.16872 type:complete len:487 (-) Transcript_7360:69-1529(-)
MRGAGGPASTSRCGSCGRGGPKAGGKDDGGPPALAVQVQVGDHQRSQAQPPKCTGAGGRCTAAVARAQVQARAAWDRPAPRALPALPVSRLGVVEGALEGGLDGGGKPGVPRRGERAPFEQDVEAPPKGAPHRERHGQREYNREERVQEPRPREASLDGAWPAVVATGPLFRGPGGGPGCVGRVRLECEGHDAEHEDRERGGRVAGRVHGHGGGVLVEAEARPAARPKRRAVAHALTFFVRGQSRRGFRGHPLGQRRRRKRRKRSGLLVLAQALHAFAVRGGGLRTGSARRRFCPVRRVPASLAGRRRRCGRAAPPLGRHESEGHLEGGLGRRGSRRRVAPSCEDGVGDGRAAGVCAAHGSAAGPRGGTCPPDHRPGRRRRVVPGAFSVLLPFYLWRMLGGRAGAAHVGVGHERPAVFGGAAAAKEKGRCEVETDARRRHRDERARGLKPLLSVEAENQRNGREDEVRREAAKTNRIHQRTKHLHA